MPRLMVQTWRRPCELERANSTDCASRQISTKQGRAKSCSCSRVKSHDLQLYLASLCAPATRRVPLYEACPSAQPHAASRKLHLNRSETPPLSSIKHQELATTEARHGPLERGGSPSGELCRSSGRVGYPRPVITNTRDERTPGSRRPSTYLEPGTCQRRHSASRDGRSSGERLRVHDLQRRNRQLEETVLCTPRIAAASVVLEHCVKDADANYVGIEKPAADAALVFVPSKATPEHLLQEVHKVAFRKEHYAGNVPKLRG